MEVDLQGIKDRFPRPLMPEEDKRLELLAQDAMDLIRMEFLRRGRDLDTELVVVPWLAFAVPIVVRRMVNAAILVGQNAGIRSASSTTGPQSDSVTYADVDSTAWGDVALTDALKEMLGLDRGGPRGKFPPPRRWPEHIPVVRGWL